MNIHRMFELYTMNDLPHEIVGEILIRSGPLHRVSQVSKLFNSLCEPLIKPLRNWEELELAIDEDDIRRIKISEDLVEKHIYECTSKMYDTKNRGFGIYLLDYGATQNFRYYVFDDISLIEAPGSYLQGMMNAGNCDAIKLFTHFYSLMVKRKITNLREDVIKYPHCNHVEPILVKLFLHDIEVLKTCCVDDVLHMAIRKKDIQLVRWALERTEITRDNLYEAAISDIVELFEKYDPNELQYFMRPACENNSTKVLD